MLMRKRADTLLHCASQRGGIQFSSSHESHVYTLATAAEFAPVPFCSGTVLL